MALRPQFDPNRVGAAVTADGTVQQTQISNAPTPKYLIRSDGVVRLYSAILAADPNFRPSNSLPSDHISGVQTALRRDDGARLAQIKQESEQRIRDEMVASEQKRREEKSKTDFLAMYPEVSPEDERKGKQDTDTFIISTADYAGLQRYCDNNALDYVVINTKPVDLVRSEILALVNQDTQAPAAPAPKPVEFIQPAGDTVPQAPATSPGWLQAATAQQAAAQPAKRK